MWLCFSQSAQAGRLSAFVTSFVGGGEFMTTTCTTGSQYAATVCSAHALAETMAVSALGIRRLVSTLGHDNL